MKRQAIRITLHSLCIFALTVLFCKLIPYDPANMPNFGASIDRDITDFYNSVANERQEARLDTNIVLVDIGLAGREQLANALELISFHNPLAIGLDVVFDTPKDYYEDSCLVSAIQSIDNIVIASALDDDKKSFFDDGISFQFKGFAELGDVNNVIRQYYTDSICGKDTIRSFASQVIRQSGLEQQRRSKNGDFIIYPSIEYDMINIDEIQDSREKIEGKIVLVGTLAYNEDIFYTPTDMRMNGVCVHAHILSTMLSDKKISYLPKSIQWIVAFIVIFALIFLRVHFMFGGNAMGDFIVRIMQFLVVWLFVYVSYLLFIHYYLYCDLSIALLSCISLLVADAWQAGLYVVDKVKKSHFKKTSKSNG